MPTIAKSITIMANQTQKPIHAQQHSPENNQQLTRTITSAEIRKLVISFTTLLRILVLSYGASFILNPE